MPESDIRDEITNLYRQEQESKKNITKLRAQHRHYNFELQNIKRTGSDGSGTLPYEKIEQANAHFVTQKNQVIQARSDLIPKLQNFFTKSPKQMITEYCSDKIPFLLFPVRLEIKFKQIGNEYELWVRVFPDDIVIYSHEANITREEFDDLRLYERRKANDPSEDGAKNAWKELVENYGQHRAAWLKKIIVDKDDPDTKDIFQTRFPNRDFFEQEVTLRPESWSDAPKSFLMPDQFVFKLYRKDGTFIERVGKPIPHPLTVGPDPKSLEESQNADFYDDQLSTSSIFDQDSDWIKDFNKADDKGMGIKIEIEKSDFDNGFTKIIALGIKASAKPKTSQEYIFKTFESHHYTNGFAFVSQGTSTNNTENAQSGYSSDDNNSEESYILEDSPLLDENSNENLDGKRFAKYLRLDWRLFENIENANDTEYLDAYHMNKVLWPSTMGYYLSQMLDPNFLSDISQRKKFYEASAYHFTKYIIGRGPTSAFRVDSVPYSIICTSNYSNWESSQFDSKNIPQNLQSFDAMLNPKLSTLVSRLQTKWNEMASDRNKIPKLGSSEDPDKELQQILGMDAGTRSIRLRPVIGNFYLWHLVNFVATPNMEQDSLYDDIWNSVIASLPNVGSLHYNAIHIFWLAVQEMQKRIAQLYSELTGISFNGESNTYSKPKIFETAPFGFLLPLEKPLAYDESVEFEESLIEYLDQIKNKTYDEIKELTPTNLLYELIKRSILTKEYKQRNSSSPPYAWINDSLEHLYEQGKIHPQRLKLLLCEHLDLCTHRLDAWTTSMAIKRLENMSNDGIHLGAFGFLENLKPKKRQKNAGFIHAPSITHAQTAAVLRSAYFNNAKVENPEVLNINLSSDRTRKALKMIDGVREGISLSAILGSQFERGLHENYPTLNLDKYIHVFRELYPLNLLEKNNDNTEKTEPNDSVIPRNVVDGLKLVRAWRSFKKRDGKEEPIPFGKPIKIYNDTVTLPTISIEYNAITKELDLIDDLLDAAYDLGLAESIFQLINKNYETSGALLDGLEGGEYIPEPEIVKTPRRGYTLEHNFVLLFTGKPTGELPRRYSSPRSLAEPNLNKWLSQIIGDPSLIYAKTRFLKTELSPEIADEVTLDLQQENHRVFSLVLDKDASLKIINPPSNRPNFQFELKIVQDELGNHSITFPSQIPNPPPINTGSGDLTNIEISTTNQGQSYTATTIQSIDPNISDIVSFADLMDRGGAGLNDEQKFSPLDLLYMTESPLKQANSEIEQRISYYIRKKRHLLANKQIIIEDTRDSSKSNDHKSIFDILQLGKSLMDVLANSDHLKPSETLLDEETDMDEAYDVEILTRLSRTKTELNTLKTSLETNLQPNQLREKLFEASKFGIPSTIPNSTFETDSQTVDEDLQKRKISTLLEINSRLEKCQQIIDKFGLVDPNTAKKISKMQQVIEAFKALLGKSFTVIPLFIPVNKDEIFSSFDLLNKPAPSGNDVNSMVTKDEKNVWFTQTSLTNKRLRQFQDFLTYYSAFERKEFDLHLFQIPFIDQDYWIGKQIKYPENFVSGTKSFEVFYTQSSEIDDTEPFGAILIDSWKESVPFDKEDTSVVFNFDAPASEPAHNPLLVVPPVISDDSDPHWNWEFLEGAINDTFEIAKSRGVDLDAYKKIGSILPGIYLPTHLTKNFKEGL